MDEKEILYFLTSPDMEEELFQRADRVRSDYCGTEVHIRGIIEFSNYCCRNCLYCGLRKDNHNIERYRMKPEEIISLALDIAQLGVKTVVLQSGDDFHYSCQVISRIISSIKRTADVAITLSVGERPLDEYKAFRDAGADRYLMKHETASESLYQNLHPYQSLRERLKILEYLKRLGYQIGAGNIVGLPGQTAEDLCQDILLLRSLGSDMAGVGPFIPQKDTPLRNYPTGNLGLTFRVLALARIVTLNTHLPASTALATLDPLNGQANGLKAGANVIMPDFTPSCYGVKYSIYDNKAHVTLEEAKQVISRCGREVSHNKGHSLRLKE